jgi:rRNA maturation RNase YbeY
VIEFITEDISAISIDENSISAWIENIINKEEKTLGNVCFVLCSDKYLLNINQQYLKHNYYTDVITFDYSEQDIISGDIFISIDRIKENAENYNKTFINELLRIIIHGILHLMGYDDKSDTDKKIMTSKEDESLNLYNNVG